MALFSIGGSKSSSKSQSSASSFIDPTQQQYLNQKYQTASGLLSNPFPVEGVASINRPLSDATGRQYRAGGAITGAGADTMGYSSGLMNQGYGSSLDFVGQAMGQGAGVGINTAMGAGNQYAGGVSSAGPAVGGGVNSGMANEMAMNAFGMNAAQSAGSYNQGFNQANLGNYINNNLLNAQIDAASRDVTRNLTENQLTSIASNAAGSGNSGSSRRAVMDAIAARGAGDRIADIGAQMRGAAYGQALGIEAQRASENAQLGQNNMQFNAGMMQNANQYNAGAANQLLSQGYGIGANQLESNLGRMQQAGQFNADAYNAARQFGTGVGQAGFNSNLQNQQYAAGLGAQIGSQGFSGMAQGANMMTTGIDQQLAAGNFIRDYEQQLLNQQYQQAMGPYNALNFYNQQIGDPTILNTATSSSKGKSGSVNMSFG
jgi:hypothetical protein